MSVLLEAGIEPCSLETSSAYWEPCFEASALRLEVSENNLFLHLQFDVSGPLVQVLPTKSVRDGGYSINVVFSSETSAYRFTGKPVSQTTGLYYEYQRWYDPSIGRFISQDPSAGSQSDPQSLNPYVYVENSPTDSPDPTGMADCGWDLSTWGGCVENAGGAAWNGLTTAGADTENGWNGLPNWEKAGIIIGIIAGVTVVTLGFGLVAAPSIAGGLGGADVAATLGIGGLSIGAIGGDLALGALGVGALGLGLLGLDLLSGSLVTPPSGGERWIGTSDVGTAASLRGGSSPVFTGGLGPGSVSNTMSSPENIYGTLAKPIRWVKNHPNVGRLCLAGAVVAGFGLFAWQIGESARRTRGSLDPRGDIGIALVGCVVGVGALALMPT